MELLCIYSLVPLRMMLRRDVLTTFHNLDLGEIPDEQKALELLGSGTLLPGIADPKLPQHVTSQVRYHVLHSLALQLSSMSNVLIISLQLEGLPPHQVVVTVDPKLTESNLPQYPPLPPTHDTRKIEEIRRTALIANVDPEVSA